MNPIPRTAGHAVAAALTFTAVGHAVGNWIQRRIFMATDFKSVVAHDVRKMKAEPTEDPPVYFVETRIG